MRRGEIWIGSGPGYLGKPRPVVVIQADAFSDTASITVCPLTSDPAEFDLFRLPVEPSAFNGLTHRSQLMADKIATTSRAKLRERIGALESETLARLGLLIVSFLALET